MCELIEIEIHLVNDIKLETASSKIDLKSSFTPIPMAPSKTTQERTDTPPSYVAKTNEAAYYHVMSASTSTQSTSTDIPPSISSEKKPDKKYFGLNLTPLRETIVSEVIQHIVAGIDTD